VSRDGAVAKLGGAKNKINKRIAHVWWLLFKKQPPPPWATAKTPAHSTIKIINTKITPPLPKPLP